MNWMECIGIAATCVVLLSFLQKSEQNIRRVNIIGSILFVVYGVLINSLSVWLLNGICIIVNIYKLLRDRQAAKVKSAKNTPVEVKTESPEVRYHAGYVAGYEHGYDDGFNALYKSSHYAEVISEGTLLDENSNNHQQNL